MLREVNKKINRRIFYKHSCLGVLGAGFMDKSDFNRDRNGGDEELPRVKAYRMLGRTGFKVSDIGCGMSVVPDVSFMKALVKSGVNYFWIHRY